MNRPGEDLSPILRSWKYEDGKHIRRVRTGTGREVIQVRLPLGVEQYEINGRPDGECPEHEESWFDLYRKKAQSEGSEFELAPEQVTTLQEECLLYYHRYLLFFQINEYKLCARDTLRNLRVLDFAARHSGVDVVEDLEQYRPYILRMHVMARALSGLQDGGDVRRALELIERGIQAIEELDPIADNTVFQVERKRSIRSLEDLHEQLQGQLPRTPRQELEEKLEEAVRSEDYEKAARLRDQISELRAAGGREEG